MKPFVESNDLLNDPAGLRKRLRDQGYLFLRDMYPREDVLTLRREVLNICNEAGWLRPGAELMEGLTDHTPIVEGEESWKPVYEKIQKLELFHRIKLTPKMLSLTDQLFEEQSFALPMSIARIAFPRDNARGTQPHQDWLYVGGSMETLSCWAPLGDVPINVGGLKLLENSHKAGFFMPRPAQGPGGNTINVPADGQWLQSDYRAGDVLLFKALTVHGAAENHTQDRLRLSIDYRYTGRSHTVTDGWMQPHFHWLGDHFSWDALDKDWRDSPTSRYWERLGFEIKTKQHERIVAS